MPTFIALLRGVNVRPRWVKMARLREVLTTAEFTDVDTYIQSGNVKVTTALRSPDRVRARLEALIEGEFGFSVPCIVRRPAELVAVAAYADGLASPLDPSEIGEKERRYVTFVSEPLTRQQLDFYDSWHEPGERLHGHEREIYWWLGKPTHQAKISNSRHERLGLVSTTRDLKVVRTLADRWGG